MATPNEQDIKWISGKLILNPVNSTGPDYGGTQLGSGRGFRLRPQVAYIPNYNVELGGAHRWFLHNRGQKAEFILREWNTDGLQNLFHGGTSTGFTIPGSGVTGTELTGNTYLWAADRPTDESVLVYNAFPMIRDHYNSLRYSEAAEWNFFLTLQCILQGLTNDQIRSAPIATLFP